MRIVLPLSFRRLFRPAVSLAVIACLLATSGEGVHAWGDPSSLRLAPPGSPLQALFEQRALVTRMVGMRQMIGRPRVQPNRISLAQLAGREQVELPLPPGLVDFFPPDQTLNQRLLPTVAIGLGVSITAFLTPLVNGPPGVALACGNALLIAAASHWSLKQMLRIGRDAVRVLDVRGWQSGGWVSYFRDGSGIRARVKNPKRGDLSKNMQRMFRVVWLGKMLSKLTQGALLKAPSAWILHGHVRFATASRSQLKESHPHQWSPARRRTVWRLKKGRLTSVSYQVLNTISHNGDFDDINQVWRQLSVDQREAIENQPLIAIEGKTLSQREAGAWLNRIFHTQSSLKGDSPKIAGFIDLLHAQGQWDAAARVAWVLAVNQSPVDSPLTEADVLSLSRIIETLFRPIADALFPSGITALSAASPTVRLQLEQALRARLSHDPVWGPRLGQHSQAFAHLAVRFFLDYDLYTATHEFMKRSVGSFGLVVTSSLSPGIAIVTARKQPMSIGLSRDGTLLGAFSETAALKLHPFERRLDLNMEGETAEIGLDEQGAFVNLYPEPYVSDPATLDEPVVQVSQTELGKRLVPLSGNPLVDPLPKFQGRDPIGQDISDMPAVARNIRSTWDRSQSYELDDPQGFTLQTARDFSAFFISKALEKFVLSAIPINRQSTPLIEWLVPHTEEMVRDVLAGRLRPQDLEARTRRLTEEAQRWVNPHASERPRVLDEARPIDLLLVGFEDSLWLGEQFVQDFEKLFGKTRLLTMLPESSNKVLRALKDQEKRKDFQLHIPGGVINRQTIVLIVSQSGQTFPTINSVIQLMDKLELETHHRVFALTGELDTPLAHVLGQRITPGAPFSRRVFLNRSGRRPAEPSSVAAMAAHMTLTELLLYVSEDLRTVFPNGFDPLGLKLSISDIEELKRLRDQSVERDIPLLVGRDSFGDTVDSPFHQHLEAQARRWTLHIWDLWVGAAVSALYIFSTVAFHVPTLGHMIGLPGAFLGVIDALVYLFMGAVGIWLFRVVTRRDVFARLGSRKVFLADIPHVYRPLEMYFTKLFSLAFKGLGVTIHGGNPRDHFTPSQGHRAARGDLVWLGLPDARMRTLAPERASSALSVKQFYGNISMGSSVETLSTGRNGIREPLFEDHLSIPSQGNLPQTTSRENVKALELLNETRFDALARMVEGFVFGHAVVRRVTLRGRLWNFSRTQGGARIFTTASPESGARSTLWDFIVAHGWATREQTETWAFTEEIIFGGLLLAVPLALLGPDIGGLTRALIIGANAVAFGFLFHRENRLRNALFAVAFHAPFLLPRSNVMVNLLAALGFHFFTNRIVTSPVRMRILTTTSSHSAAASAVGAEKAAYKIRSRFISRPGVLAYDPIEIPESNGEPTRVKYRPSAVQPLAMNEELGSAVPGAPAGRFKSRPPFSSPPESLHFPVSPPEVTGSRIRWMVAAVFLTALGATVYHFVPALLSHAVQGAGALVHHALGLLHHAVPVVSHVAQTVPMAPAPAAPALSLGAAASEVASNATQAALRHSIGVSPNDLHAHSVGQMVLKLRASDPVLAKALHGPLWGTQGAAAKLWDVIGPQTQSHNIDLIQSNQSFDLSSLYANAASAAVQSVPQAALSVAQDATVQAAGLGFSMTGFFASALTLFPLTLLSFARSRSRPLTHDRLPLKAA